MLIRDVIRFIAVLAIIVAIEIVGSLLWQTTPRPFGQLQLMAALCVLLLAIREGRPDA